MKSTVYIPNKSCHDFSAAQKFGELYFITDGPIQRFKTSVMYRYLWDVLKYSRPKDKLLVTGMTVTNMIAAAIFGYLHGRINLLLYDPTRKEKYIERTVLLDKDSVRRIKNGN